MPLREAICAWHKRELGSAYEPKECVVSVGGKHSIFNVMSVLVQQGDEVIIPRRTGELPDIVKVRTRNACVRRNASGRRLQREGSGHRKASRQKQNS